jgi:hypothetical protein
MCPTDSNRTKTATPSCGANMMPVVSSIRGQASRPDVRPLASSAANTTTSVYVIAAATWAVSVCRPMKRSSITYCGSSVV